MALPLSENEWAEHLRSFSYTAFRLEVQPAYAEDEESATVQRFLAGDPQVPTEVPGLRSWLEQVASLTGQGKRIERVRVHDDPPTAYQRWVRWMGHWNAEAGESIRYMTRAKAQDVGLTPAAGNTDWWLLDSNRLIVMRFDDEGHRIENELVTDPIEVLTACAWRDLAVHHSTLDDLRGAAA